jgi:hypothetical protein
LLLINALLGRHLLLLGLLLFKLLLLLSGLLHLCLLLGREGRGCSRLEGLLLVLLVLLLLLVLIWWLTLLLLLWICVGHYSLLGLWRWHVHLSGLTLLWHHWLLGNWSLGHVGCMGVFVLIYSFC